MFPQTGQFQPKKKIVRLIKYARSLLYRRKCTACELNYKRVVEHICWIWNWYAAYRCRLNYLCPVMLTPAFWSSASISTISTSCQYLFTALKPWMYNLPNCILLLYQLWFKPSWTLYEFSKKGFLAYVLFSISRKQVQYWFLYFSAPVWMHGYHTIISPQQLAFFISCICLRFAIICIQGTVVFLALQTYSYGCWYLTIVSYIPLFKTLPSLLDVMKEVFFSD